MTSNGYRRLYGLLLGAVLGLAYGLVSQTINQILIPGVPLYQPPFGAVGNILFSTAFVAILGLANAWFETGGVGVIISSLIGSIVLLISSILAGNMAGEALFRVIFLSFLILLPIAGAVAIVMIALRWVINKGDAYHHEAISGQLDRSWLRVGLPAAVVLIAALFGLFSLIPSAGRAAVARMDKMIQQGLQAQNRSSLPAPLRSYNVNSFIAQAQGPYTLQWDKDEKNQFIIPRPANATSDISTVIARFDNGYLLACVFPGVVGEPECKDFGE